MIFRLFIALIIFLAGTPVGYSQNSEEKDTFNYLLHTTQTRMKLNDTVESVRVYFENGKIFEEKNERTDIKKNRHGLPFLVGYYKRYHTGTYNLITEGTYNGEGEKEGKWIYYYPDGTKQSEVAYGDGVFFGDYLEYCPTGTLKMRGKMDSTTLVLIGPNYTDRISYIYKAGSWEYYYANGVLKEAGAYTHIVNVPCYNASTLIYYLGEDTLTPDLHVVSLRDALWNEYDETGKLVRSITYHPMEIMRSISKSHDLPLKKYKIY